MRFFSLAVAYVAVLVLSGVPFAHSARALEPLEVRVNYSQLLQLDEGVETVVVGNDTVANATLANRNTIVITGFSVGSTNLILLDEAGAELFSAMVSVVPIDPRPQHAIRLITGGANESTSVYICGPGPGCSPGGDRAFGPCMNPDDIAADGSRCGDRAASVRPRGVDGEGQPEDAQ